MPGIKEQGAADAAPPHPPGRRTPRAPLIERVERQRDASPLPDPTPYQTHREIQQVVPGGVVTTTDTGWTKRGLQRWLRTCPKDSLTVPWPAGSDPNARETAKVKTVYYDGYSFDVPYGVETRVPRPIAEIIRQSLDPFPTMASRGINLYALNQDHPNGRPLDHGDGFGGQAAMYAGDDDAYDDDEE